MKHTGKVYLVWSKGRLFNTCETVEQAARLLVSAGDCSVVRVVDERATDTTTTVSRAYLASLVNMPTSLPLAVVRSVSAEIIENRLAALDRSLPVPPIDVPSPISGGPPMGPPRTRRHTTCCMCDQCSPDTPPAPISYAGEF